MKLFMTDDKTAGFALKGDDIVSVFKHANSSHKKVGDWALKKAIRAGGRKLDCFDTILPQLYSNNHFRAVSRVKFDDEYAPENWDYAMMGPYNKGRPDVVFMVYDPSYTKPYSAGDGVLCKDYDEAQSVQSRELKKVR